MLHCPTCDSEFDEALAACPQCDGDFGEPVRCPRCSTEYVGPGCPACGALSERLPCDAHPDREAAGQCVVCGRLLCPECNAVQQRAYLCGEHRGVRVTDGWAEVYTTTSEVEAQLLRDDLRAQGIDAQVLSQRDIMFSVEMGELSIVRLLVPVWTYAEAAEAMAAYSEGTPGEDACPSCGTVVQAGVPECPGCGRVLG
jgi:hypothetical protein